MSDSSNIFTSGGSITAPAPSPVSQLPSNLSGIVYVRTVESQDDVSLQDGQQRDRLP